VDGRHWWCPLPRRARSGARSRREQARGETCPPHAQTLFSVVFVKHPDTRRRALMLNSKVPRRRVAHAGRSVGSQVREAHSSEHQRATARVRVVHEHD